jgi:hypothetical protein
MYVCIYVYISINIAIVITNAIILYVIITLFIEWKSGDKHDICKNTKAILFYSTPHRGSHVAALKQTTQMLVWPTVEVQELREGNSSSYL